MSVIFFDGFETLGTSTGVANRGNILSNVSKRWTTAGDTIAPSTDGFYLMDDFVNEGYALNMGKGSLSNTSFIRYLFPESLSGPPSAETPEIRIGFRVHVPSEPRTFSILQIRGRFDVAGFSDQIVVKIVDSTDLKVICGTTALATETFDVEDVFSPGQWHFVEIHAKCTDSGLVVVHVDDVEVLYQNPQDCNAANGVSAMYDLTLAGATSGGGANDYAAYDDFYLLNADEEPNADRLSASRVFALPPIADQLSEWEPSATMSLAVSLNSAGENFLNVGSGNIPPDMPSSGVLRVILDTGFVRKIAYSYHNGDDQFSITPESWLSPNDASMGAEVSVFDFGNNYTKVNSSTLDDITYLQTTLQGATDRYAIENLANTSKSVFAVSVEAEAENPVGGDPTIIVQMHSGGTYQEEFVVDDLLTYHLFVSIYEVDPSTDSAWESSDINAIEAGFKFDNGVS